MALVLAAIVPLVAAAPAEAAPKRITGKLSRSGYTVIALASNGKAEAVPTRRGRFRLTPPSRRVTLHLRARDGTYAGPVVLGSLRRGRRAVVGVKAGASLGRISVRRGYARVGRRRARRAMDRRRLARSKRGVPIGARKVGRTRSRPPRRAPRDDRDLDGIPDSIDVDDDGDLVLDDVDPDARAGAAQDEEPPFAVHTVQALPAETLLNANAAAIDQAAIDAALAAEGRMIIGLFPTGAELDCGGAVQQPARAQGLPYCSTGGTGRVFGQGCCGRPSWPRFPDEFDADGDGMGTLVNNGPGGENEQFMFLSHGATSDELQTGDVLILRSQAGDKVATVRYLFATVPALVGYSDTAGNSASVRYPVQPDDPGTNNNGFPVSAPPGEDIVLTLTFWRPQRARMAGDPAPGAGDSSQWIDIGGLIHHATLQHRFDATPGGLEISRSCPMGSYSVPQGQPLTPIPHPGLQDTATDAPANSVNTFTYQVNLSACLADVGVTLSPGESIGITFTALSANGGNADSNVVFTRR